MGDSLSHLDDLMAQANVDINFPAFFFFYFSEGLI